MSKDLTGTQSCGCIVDDMEHKANRANAKCISFDKKSNKYRARISRYNRMYSLGRFSCYKDAENIVLIAKTFTDVNDFQKWLPNKRESYESLQSICQENKIDVNVIVQSIFDSFLGGLYLNNPELELFIKDFSETYKDL